MEGHTPQLECEYRIIHKDTTYQWVLNRGLSVRDISGKIYRMAGSQTDITDRKKAEQQLLHDAFHDALTDLPNRALFTDRLYHCIQQQIKGGRRPFNFMYAVFFVDLDRFKIINDSLGHAIGDKLLIEISKRLVSCLRPGDTVARFGGDEFAILLNEIKSMNDVYIVIDRIMEAIPRPLHLNGNEIFTTASIGIALSSTGYSGPEDVIRDADIAMYQAKTKGKARYEIFDTKMHASTVARLQLENDLRKAVEHNEFILHYQPIKSLKNNRVIGFEALIRWDHPKRGLIYPMEFIPLAEETGLIQEIGKSILEKACKQLAEWHELFPMDPPLKVSVNISSKQFAQNDLVNQVGDVLKDYCLDSCCLALEVTESMIMDDAEVAITKLNQLKDMGVHIHIDDFGTGYSSLSYIHRFPVNALKIDKSFVSKMSVNEENMEIIKTIINLANNLNIDLIAEGLEMSDQLDQLKELKCNYAQGFFISRPMEPKALEAWLKSELQSA
jgi:diguanylate cyclase (GGDEF)-like protein